MKVLLVGAGPMAVAYGQVLNAMAVSWTAIGRGETSAAKFAAATGVRPVPGGFASYLGKRGRLSDVAVILAVPVLNVAEAAKAFIDAGAARILVEKPAGLTPSEIEQVAQAAAQSRSQVFVAYNRRFYASVEAARELIAEDGGVTSFHMEFTERANRVAKSIGNPTILRNWFLNSSTHVIDLAFHLCGQPSALSGITGGNLDWHPSGAVFVGHGRTKTGAIFSWHADWTSAGRWGLDVRTPRRRLILQPIETLVIQEKSSFDLVPHVIADELDRQYKPGLYRQVDAFLSADPAATALPTIASHSETVRRWFSSIWKPGAAPAATAMLDAAS